MDLSHKNIVVIGDLDSLARGVAQSLHQAGANIIPTNPPDSPLDLTNPTTLQGQITSMGAIDGAILCPSWYKIDDFLNTTNADWDEALERNFEYMVYAMQAVAKVMIDQKRGGSIVILSSVVSIMPFAQTSALGTSLSALWAVAKMAAVDLAPHNITVNIVALGWVESDWQQQFLHEAGREYIQRGIP